MLWTTHDVSLTDEHRAAAQEVIEQLGGVEQFSLLMLSGSFAAGLGHSASDVDLYVTRVDNAPVESVAYPRRGFMVQVTEVDRAAAERIAARAGSFAMTATNRDALRLSPAERRLLIRLSIGELLHADADFDRTLAGMDRIAVQQSLNLPRALATASWQEDVAGAILSEDPYTADQASYLALQEACDIALVAGGDIYDGQKFLYRRLARSAVFQPLMDVVWELFHTPLEHGGSKERVFDVARRRCRLASFLVGHAVTTGWTVPLTELPEYRNDAEGPLRSPYFGLVQYLDGISLAGADRGYKVTPALARLWLALDGRSIEQVRAEVLGEDSSAHDEFDAAIARLVELGAVEEPAADRSAG
ncbi:hypothetical protein [Streptomyces aureoversilis]|uniref:Polymerase nucleotidyl transferase domain-containing protein n=1 Tax=Streptomyces aureoversilis TaxID=67277 RepID=A0ABW0A1P8_9ACTN